MTTAGRRRRRLPRWLTRGAGVVVLALAVEYVIVPQLSGVRHSVGLVGQVWLPVFLLVVVLEAAALVSYSLLTRALVPGPPLRTLLRIDLSALALSHVVPAGGAGATALRYRLLTVVGGRTGDVILDTVVQPVGSAIVLNLMVWPVLLITLPRGGVGPGFTVAATAGLVMLSAAGVVVFALLREQRWTASRVRVLAARVPRLDAERAVAQVRRFAEQLRRLSEDRRTLAGAITWATLNWLFDATALWVLLAAFDRPIAPDRVFAAYGLANIAGAIPLTPGGIGVIEGVLASTLVAGGIPHGEAILAVLTWRLVNFWLPIPVGGLAFLSLRAGPLRGRARRRAPG